MKILFFKGCLAFLLKSWGVIEIKEIRNQRKSSIWMILKWSLKKRVKE